MPADAPTPVPYAARPSRTPLYAIGGGILAVLVLIAGIGGWTAWDGRQDGEARAAYRDYTTAHTAAESAINEAVAFSSSLKFDKVSEAEKDHLAKGRDDAIDRADRAADAMISLTRRWSARWARMGLEYDPSGGIGYKKR